MSEPFFDYITNNRNTVSNQMYGQETNEKRYIREAYQLLPQTNDSTVSLVETLRSRKTTRMFKDAPLQLPALSGLLQLSLSKDTKSDSSFHFSFPSGGGLYPIETYLLVIDVEGLKSGVYHYSATEHSIARISDAVFDIVSLNSDFGTEFTTLPQALVLMTMVKSRCVYKYGSLSYTLVLLEAGHRGQNICLAAAANKIGVCPMGGANYTVVNKMLGVDGVNEHYIYSLAIGK